MKKIEEISGEYQLPNGKKILVEIEYRGDGPYLVVGEWEVAFELLDKEQ